MKLVLLGYMSVGKSTLGQLLADHLQIKFIDLDRYIEVKEGQTLPELFKDKGEIYFRKAESAALEELLSNESDYVLALGGGTPVYANNMEKINTSKGVTSVYLKLELMHLVKRLFREKENRPLISHYKDLNEFEDFVRKHLFERQQYYFLADHVLDVTNSTPEESLNKLLELVK